jgi:RNA polymerase sigma factor (sigma-70 family)
LIGHHVAGGGAVAAEQQHPTTQQLTAALAAGEEQAVEWFYRQYFDWLYAQARRASGGRDEAFCLDVVQDAVLRVMRTVRAVPMENQFRAWLKLVVHTAACDRLRSERRRQNHELAAAATVVAGRVDESADECVDRDEQLAWLQSQIARLDPRIAQLIEWRFQQRWTLARISERLGLSIGTIDGRLRRAIRGLREQAVEKFEQDVFENDA